VQKAGTWTFARLFAFPNAPQETEELRTGHTDGRPLDAKPSFVILFDTALSKIEQALPSAKLANDAISCRHSGWMEAALLHQLQI
jgi:hypothetical protein